MAVYGLNRSPYRSQYRKDIDTRAIVGGSPLSTPSGGYATTQANFPGLLEAFEGINLSGTTLPGTLGHVTITFPNGISPGIPAGSFAPNTALAVDTSGTWPTIGTKNFILIAIGSSGNNTTIGDSTATRIGTGNITSGAAINRFDGTNNFTFSDSAIASATVCMTILDQRSANGAATRVVYYSDGINVTQTATVTGDISRDWGTLVTGTSKMQITSDFAGSYYLTQMYLLALETYPSTMNFTEAAAWMNTHKKLYPGFYGFR